MALSILIPYLYLLAITAYSFSVSAIVVGIRVGIRVVVGLKKLGSGLRLRSRLRSGVYVLYSRRAYKVFLARLLFS